MFLFWLCVFVAGTSWELCWVDTLINLLIMINRLCIWQNKRKSVKIWLTTLYQFHLYHCALVTAEALVQCFGTVSCAVRRHPACKNLFHKSRRLAFESLGLTTSISRKLDQLNKKQSGGNSSSCTHHTLVMLFNLSCHQKGCCVK